NARTQFTGDKGIRAFNGKSSPVDGLVFGSYHLDSFGTFRSDLYFSVGSVDSVAEIALVFKALSKILMCIRKTS
ncbi:MAG: hypothetical protein ACTHY5_00660, partial [Oceanisphaera sp.]|uniref:hypothetical protein n=1 Tax=Oceanisphaera sp. TaxID=1929979 RepID=UPI003F98808A